MNERLFYVPFNALLGNYIGIHVATPKEMKYEGWYVVLSDIR